MKKLFLPFILIGLLIGCSKPIESSTPSVSTRVASTNQVIVIYPQQTGIRYHVIISNPHVEYDVPYANINQYNNGVVIIKDFSTMDKITYHSEYSVEEYTKN